MTCVSLLCTQTRSNVPGCHCCLSSWYRATSARERRDRPPLSVSLMVSVLTQRGWRRVAAALGLKTGSRVWLQLRPAEGSIHIRALNNSDAAAGGANAADDGVDDADWDEDSDSAADDDDAAVDEDVAAAADPQVSRCWA